MHSHHLYCSFNSSHRSGRIISFCDQISMKKMSPVQIIKLNFKSVIKFELKYRTALAYRSVVDVAV